MPIRLFDTGHHIRKASAGGACGCARDWPGSQHSGPRLHLVRGLTHVKFYRLSLRASVELDAGPFPEGFHHVEGWVPQRLVTATGPNPLPR